MLAAGRYNHGCRDVSVHSRAVAALRRGCCSQQHSRHPKGVVSLVFLLAVLRSPGDPDLASWT